MEPSDVRAQPGCAACGHDHLVEFYETEEFLVASVADFVSAALGNGDAAIVVATPEHCAAFDDALYGRGVDIEEAVHEGRYLVLDAAALLSTFMVVGAPDRERFQSSVTPLLDRGSASGREVSVYGEMVALLWAAGDVTSTIALEDMWHELAGIRAFSLLCGYPISSFDVQSREIFKHICGQHNGVRTEQRAPDPDPA